MPKMMMLENVILHIKLIVNKVILCMKVEKGRKKGQVIFVSQGIKKVVKHSVDRELYY